jgi:hypothetical protein
VVPIRAAVIQLTSVVWRMGIACPHPGLRPGAARAARRVSPPARPSRRVGGSRIACGGVFGLHDCGDQHCQAVERVLFGAAELCRVLRIRRALFVVCPVSAAWDWRLDARAGDSSRTDCRAGLECFALGERDRPHGGNDADRFGQDYRGWFSPEMSHVVRPTKPRIRPC